MKKRSKPKHPLRAVLTVAPDGTVTTPAGQPASPPPPPNALRPRPYTIP
ncbi:MAG: hypothetical protein LIO52_01415 [Oscillospiraceae bacterium]|nr:hypothetical protein [Oscillospiraceae bacterium]